MCLYAFHSNAPNNTFHLSHFDCAAHPVIIAAPHQIGWSGGTTCVLRFGDALYRRIGVFITSTVFSVPTQTTTCSCPINKKTGVLTAGSFGVDYF
jgi:hypothetical protein